MSRVQDTSRLKSLEATIELCAKTQLYASKGLSTIKLTTLDDIQKLPFTTKEDLRGAYPYGGLAVSHKDIVEVHTSSGTSGTPVGSFLTKRDIETGNAAIGRAWRQFGITKNSRVMFAMRYGLFSGAAINTYAIQSLGGFVVPAGIIPVDQHIQHIMDYKIDTVIGLPGFFRYLHSRLEYHGIDIDTFPLKTIIAAGETYSEKTRQEIEESLQARVYDHYGLAEVNTGIAYECDERKGLHILDDYVIAEVIGVDGKPVAIGEKGELVLTSLGKEASPILRYKTGDMTCAYGTVTCPCGTTSTMIARIMGRIDSTVSVKGVKIDPYELRSMIQQEFPNLISHGVCSFSIQKNRIDYRPKLIVAAGILDPDMDKLSTFLAQKTGIDFEVTTMPLSYWFDGKNKAKLVEYE